jgi:hypothetical protein
MLRGAAAIGPLLVTFTLLDDAPGPEREALLAIVRGARAVEDGARADAAEGAPDAAIRLEPDPTAATTPLSVEPPGLPFLVLVDLPGFAMFGQREVEGTGWLAVGQDAEAGLVASVIVSPAEAKGAAAGARACRDAALARARAVVPDLSELALDETPGAARATYVAGGPRGNGPRHRHAHAFLARDGTCVDVHVSAAEVKPEHLERMERILGSVRFGERL